MIGTLPVSRLAPLDYRCALDAARMALGSTTEPVVTCNAPALVDEVRQRFPCWTESWPANATSVLWIEPLADTWRVELSTLENVLTPGGTMAIVVSQPLARVLPECRVWGGRALGMRINGLTRLRHTLVHRGFTIEVLHGFHSMLVIGMNLWSRQAERWGHPELGDRLHFAARLRYRADGPLISLSTATVVLLIAQKLRHS